MVDLPDAPWAPKDELPNAPWAASPEAVPKPFMDRVRAGQQAEKNGTADNPGDPLFDGPPPIFANSPFEDAAARVRRRYPQNERKIGLGPYIIGGLLQHMSESLGTLPQRAIEEAGELQRTGEYGKDGEMPTGLEAALLTLGTGTKFTRTTLERVTQAPSEQVIGTLPKDADFKTGAEVLGSDAAEANLRTLWEEHGIHPAEAVHDAQNDAFLRQEITTPAHNPSDRSGIAPVQGSPIPAGTPRTELARSGDPAIDRVLDSDVTRRNIDNPVIDDTHDVPYSAGGSVPLEDPTVFIDQHFPRSMTVDGVTFDPAEPFTIHENLEQHIMEMLIKGGMDAETAYKVAHFEFAEKAEAAWYRAHGIDPAKVEAAYQPFLNAIDHNNPANPPPNLYTKPYPHSNVRDAASVPVEDTPATKAQIKRAMAILDSQEATGAPLRAVGADVAQPAPTLAQQPPPSPGRLMTAAKTGVSCLLDIGRDLQMKVAPMATGTRDSMAVAKDAANAWRRNRWEWQRYDSDLEARFTPEQRARMFNAMDEESVAIQKGDSLEHQGLATLTPEERAAVEDLDARQQLAWLHAKDLGVVEGDGIPMHATRYVMNIANATDKDKALSLDAIGSNLSTRTGQMKHRKHLTVEETEAAAKIKFGDQAVVPRDIRAVALSTAKLEDAIIGRQLVNDIREIGRQTGEEVIADFEPTGSEHKWFTLDHTSFKTWRPRMEVVDEKGVPVRDANGDIIFDQVPMFIRGDFEGPLKAILHKPSGAFYGDMMSLKGKVMSLVMNSPMIHNAVEFGRAFPAMPIRIWTAYAKGNRAKNDIGLMREAIDNGLVPIGKRFFKQDIESIMEEPNLAPGRSLTAKIASAVMTSERLAPQTDWMVARSEADAAAIKCGIDKMGDFWHNTLLWDRIADLQMGLYTNFRADMLAKGADPQTASRFAAHMANRYAGALPTEAMSSAARKIANGLMFSRSFTIGNWGVMKDAFGSMPPAVWNAVADMMGASEKYKLGTAGGLPREVMAQIERDTGAVNPEAAGYAKAVARRKAVAIVMLDVGLAYVGWSVLQNVFNVLNNDSTWDRELQGYMRRYHDWLAEMKANPMTLIQAPHMLSATYDNEPSKQDRIHVGNAADGRGIYMRNPLGKIGEEFIGYATMPLEMVRRKGSTFSRPLLETYANDKGFGRKVYDPNPKFPLGWIKNIGLIANHLFWAQTPEGQLSSFQDLIKGEGDPRVNALGAFGPLVGTTFSKGAPGGPAVGEMYHAKSEHDYAVQVALPDIRKQILRGDIEGANTRMTELGMPPGLQQFIRRTTLNPATRLGGRTLRDFYMYSTPEQRERLERAR